MSLVCRLTSNTNCKTVLELFKMSFPFKKFQSHYMFPPTWSSVKTVVLETAVLPLCWFRSFSRMRSHLCASVSHCVGPLSLCCVCVVITHKSFNACRWLHRPKHAVEFKICLKRYRLFKKVLNKSCI
jgi:hypothetical protein